MYELLDHMAANIAALILAGNIDALLPLAVAALVAALVVPVAAEAISPALGVLARAGVWLIGGAVAYLTLQHVEAGMVARLNVLFTGFDAFGVMGGW